jgi:tetratricopeptide (TPR) repeat protein
MPDQSPTVHQLLETADAAAFAWVPGAESLYREALRAANAANDSAQQIEAWIALAAYLYRRARQRPAALAYASVWEKAQQAADAKWSAVAAFGISLCLEELHDEIGALAAKIYLGQLSEIEWSQLPGQTQQQLQNPEAALKASVENIRNAIPGFEKSFLSGELRFDQPEDFVDLFARPAQHYENSFLNEAGRLQRNAYRRQFMQRLILPALPLLALAVVLGMQWLPLTRGVLLLIAIPVFVYLGIWLASVRAAWRWVDAQRKMSEMEPVMSELIASSSTHEEAVAILDRFANQREPFVLYLRAFEGEASQSLTPEGVVSRSSSKQTFVENAIISGTPAGGYLEANRAVISYQSGPTTLEKYLGEHVSKLIPVITIANPAASLGRSFVPRLEVENDEWAPAVRLLLGAAHFVIIEPARNSAGVCQELNLTKDSNRHPDTIIVLPSEKTRSEMDGMRSIMAAGFAVPVGPGSNFMFANDEILAGFPRIVEDDVFANRDPLTLQVFRDVLPKDKPTSPQDYGEQRRDRIALRNRGIALHVEGVSRLDAGQSAEAGELLQAAAGIFEQCEDLAYKSMSLTYQGRAAQSSGDVSSAERYFAAAAEIQRETGPPMEYIGSVHHLALVLLDAGAHERARAAFEEMMNASRHWNYERGQARAMEGLALISFALGDRQAAVEQLREALKLSSDPRDQTSIGQALNAIEQAPSLDEKAVRELSARNQIVAIYNVAVRELESGQAGPAIAKLDQALSLSRDSAMRDLEQTVLFRLGIAYSQARERGLAIDHFRQSATISRELDDPIQTALAQSNIGTLLVREGKIEEGIQELKEAEQAQRAHNDEGELSHTLDALATAYFESREYDQSLDYDRQALELYRRQNNLRQISKVMERIGLAQMYLGDHAEARESLLKAADHAAQTGNRQQQALDIALAAQLAAKLNDATQASQLFAQSIALWEATGDEQRATEIRELARRALASEA